MNIQYIFLLVILITMLIIFMMHYMYCKKKYIKIKKYLLSCDDFAKSVLQNIIKDKHDIDFVLDVSHLVTQNFLRLEIVKKIRNDAQSNHRIICNLNSQILNFILKEPELKKIYIIS